MSEAKNYALEFSGFVGDKYVVKYCLTEGEEIERVDGTKYHYMGIALATPSTCSCDRHGDHECSCWRASNNSIDKIYAIPFGSPLSQVDMYYVNAFFGCKIVEVTD